jgi:hypothetical protein
MKARLRGLSDVGWLKIKGTYRSAMKSSPAEVGLTTGGEV